MKKTDSRSLSKMKDRIIFVINSAADSTTSQYLQEAQMKSNPKDDRGEANAFVMETANDEDDINSIPSKLTANPDLARHVIFYNAECLKWSADLVNFVADNNIEPAYGLTTPQQTWIAEEDHHIRYFLYLQDSGSCPSQNGPGPKNLPT